MKTSPVILASTSRYRADLLSRLKVPFRTVDPRVAEEQAVGETPLALSRRLALAKAQAVARLYPSCTIIGADQVLNLKGQALGKPGDPVRAKQQLAQLSEQVVTFHSAIAMVSPAGTRISVIDSVAQFRKLSTQQIERYVAIDSPTDTAGSAKAESLGIALLQDLSSNDPTAIIGLPLIELTRLLSLNGIDPLDIATLS